VPALNLVSGTEHTHRHSHLVGHSQLYLP